MTAVRRSPRVREGHSIAADDIHGPPPATPCERTAENGDRGDRVYGPQNRDAMRWHIGADRISQYGSD
ncbi:hypothetical protein [Actinopolyspora mortivallis]|uniref:Uncharacterized protein n=1 Tax=Actinopolyspora mortivallis TaxID=33906 RepID=A0A2T0GXK8_ACTMO|nr:hypothetical protein [Actinopolyspora mortivallis]PRW63855.1 hypothetical protein CEP50_07700 [Actinopolyspora mortivallis]